MNIELLTLKIINFCEQEPGNPRILHWKVPQRSSSPVSPPRQQVVRPRRVRAGTVRPQHLEGVGTCPRQPASRSSLLWLSLLKEHIRPKHGPSAWPLPEPLLPRCLWPSCTSLKLHDFTLPWRRRGHFGRSSKCSFVTSLEDPSYRPSLRKTRENGKFLPLSFQN